MLTNVDKQKHLAADFYEGLRRYHNVDGKGNGGRVEGVQLPPGVTNEAGNYIITSVPIGTYVITAELQGFKTVQSTVTLSANQTARVDFALEVGAVEERIEVVATTAVLQTENAVVGTKLEREQIEQLPVQGRNLSALTLYTPGTTQPNMGTFNSLRGAGRGSTGDGTQGGGPITRRAPTPRRSIIGRATRGCG